jgi:hypothetical protein
MAITKSEEIWPSLPLAEWQDTCATLQLWTQIVGKIRLAQAPLVNHWWQVPLYVTARGLTTSSMPYGALSFQIDWRRLQSRDEALVRLIESSRDHRQRHGRR